MDFGVDDVNFQLVFKFMKQVTKKVEGVYAGNRFAVYGRDGPQPDGN